MRAFFVVMTDMEYKNRKKLYKTKEWFRLRYNQLKKQPCCAYCEQQGAVTLATVADHIKPHKGDELLFYNPNNLQSLCKFHHDRTKQKEEKQGVVIGGNEQGIPNDPSHHWN